MTSIGKLGRSGRFFCLLLEFSSFFSFFFFQYQSMCVYVRLSVSVVSEWVYVQIDIESCDSWVFNRGVLFPALQYLSWKTLKEVGHKVPTTFYMCIDISLHYSVLFLYTLTIIIKEGEYKITNIQNLWYYICSIYWAWLDMQKISKLYLPGMLVSIVTVWLIYTRFSSIRHFIHI